MASLAGLLETFSFVISLFLFILVLKYKKNARALFYTYFEPMLEVSRVF